MQLSICVVFAMANVCANLAAGYVDGHGQAQGYDNGHVGKKGSSARYADYGYDEPRSCSREADYEISQNYIIRTKDSKAKGANFVAAISVRTFDACLEQCCVRGNCDTTIFVGEAYRSEDTNCFLFVCRPEGKGGENHCLFTYHLGYISSMKKEVGGFQGYEPPAVQDYPVTTAIPQQIVTTAKPTQPPESKPIEPIPNCPRDYFECDSGQCINDLYICNSVVDCDDGSDEYRCDVPDTDSGYQMISGENLKTDDEGLPPSLLLLPTNPPNMPNKHPDDSINIQDDNGQSPKVEAEQTLADQLHDQLPLETDDGGQKTVVDKNEERERELSDMKIRLQDESHGALPKGIEKSLPDEDRGHDQFPELECHGDTCYEIQADRGKTRFGDVIDEESESDGRKGDEGDTKLNPQIQPKIPDNTQPRNLEREEYQTGDLRDDYQTPQKSKLPDYQEDVRKFVYDKNLDEYKEGDDQENIRYDIDGRENDREVAGQRLDQYETNKHLLDDGDASEERDLDIDPRERKIVSDHDMGMKHPADVESFRNDPDQEPDRQESPPTHDGTKNWGFHAKPSRLRPPTQPPLRQGISNSEPRLGQGYAYNSDYYSYYYPPYEQVQGRYKSQQLQNNNWSRQNSHGGRNTQDSPYYPPKNNPYRGLGTQNDNADRYNTHDDIYSDSRRHHKVAVPEDGREEKYTNTDSKTRPVYNSLWNTWQYDYSSSVDDEGVIDNDVAFQNDRRNRPMYTTASKSRPHPKGHKLNAPVPVDEGIEPEAVVTVMAPPQQPLTDGKAEDIGNAEDAGKVNDTNAKLDESKDGTVEMVYESRGGSGMPPASSAILPLVIGLIITVCLLLMVGCRLRYMNQRLRYGRLKTSAHDADYLINGMYL